MRRLQWVFRLLVILFLGAFLVACGNDADPATTPTPEPTATAVPTEEPDDDSDGIVSRVRRVPGSIGGGIKDGAGWVWDRVTDAGGTIWGGIQSGAGWIWDRVTGLPGAMKDVWIKFWNWLRNTWLGEAVSDGVRILIDIKDKLDPNRIVEFLKTLFQIALMIAGVLGILALYLHHASGPIMRRGTVRILRFLVMLPARIIGFLAPKDKPSRATPDKPSRVQHGSRPIRRTETSRDTATASEPEVRSEEPAFTPARSASQNFTGSRDMTWELEMDGGTVRARQVPMSNVSQKLQPKTADGSPQDDAQASAVEPASATDLAAPKQPKPQPTPADVAPARPAPMPEVDPKPSPDQPATPPTQPGSRAASTGARRRYQRRVRRRPHSK